MSTIGVRLEEERKRLGFNQTEFGEAGGVKRQAQSKYESDERRPDADYLAAIAEKGANILYILTGTQYPMNSGITSDTGVAPPVDMESLEIAIECAELHLELSKQNVTPHKKAKLIGILYDEISQDNEQEIDESKVIRLIDLAVAEEQRNEQETEVAGQDKTVQR